MESVAAFADTLGVPAWYLIPITLLAAAALIFLLDGLSFIVLKPFRSPPVIKTVPLVGGMAAFLKGPIGLMAKNFPIYGEVFTGERRARAWARPGGLSHTTFGAGGGIGISDPVSAVVPAPRAGTDTLRGSAGPLCP